MISTEGPTAAASQPSLVAFGTGASCLAHDDAAQGKLIVLALP